MEATRGELRALAAEGSNALEDAALGLQLVALKPSKPLEERRQAGGDEALEAVKEYRRQCKSQVGSIVDRLERCLEVTERQKAGF